VNIILKSALVIAFVLSLQACATTNSATSPSQAAYGTTPSIQSNSYMYRSPTPAAMQAHGFAPRR
jgi:hypothetical protein